MFPHQIDLFMNIIIEQTDSKLLFNHRMKRISYKLNYLFRFIILSQIVLRDIMLLLWYPYNNNCMDTKNIKYDIGT